MIGLLGFPLNGGLFSDGQGLSIGYRGGKRTEGLLESRSEKRMQPIDSPRVRRKQFSIGLSEDKMSV